MIGFRLRCAILGAQRSRIVLGQVGARTARHWAFEAADEAHEQPESLAACPRLLVSEADLDEVMLAIRRRVVAKASQIVEERAPPSHEVAPRSGEVPSADRFVELPPRVPD